MHGTQQAPFTPLATNRRWLFVDSIRVDSAGRRYHLTLGVTAFGRDSALILSDETGRIARLEAGLAPYKRAGVTYPGDSARMEESRRVTLDGRLTLAESRVWDVVVTFPRAPRIGARWTDTIARVANDGPYRQTLSGRKVSRIVGDTLVAGLRLWIIRDSAFVTYEERRPERERTLDTLVQVSRTVRGVIRGVHLYDPSLRLSRFRDDTSLLAGEAVLRYPDRRTFRTPARYDRYRVWQLNDSAQYAARRAALRTESENQMGGMVYLPASDLERRLSRDTSGVRDSLLLALQQTSDDEEMLRLFGTLSRWGGRDADFRRRLDSVRIRLGDTAYLYQRLSDRAYSRHPPTDTSDVRAMIPFLEDPGKAWSLNRSRDWLYENLVQAMTLWPRAAASPRDTSKVACTAEACRMLGGLRVSAREPRSRQVALVALFSMDPATWGDTILRLAGPSHPLLRSAAALAGGVGATWTAASKLPMPPPESDWRMWLRWMDGRDTAYIRAQLAMPRPRGLPPLDTMPRPRFEETHRTAIRMLMARTGRKVIGELQGGYEQARNDTAHLVFGTLLHGLDALRLSAAQMADAFASGLPGRVALARHALVRAIADSAVPMGEAESAPLLDRLLAAVIDTLPLWPIGVPDLKLPRRIGPELHARRGRVRISALNLPSAVREKWGARVEIVTADDRDRIDDREAGVTYTVSPVLRFGSFARVEIQAAERLERAANQTPAAYAAATTYYLMNRGGEWVIVAWYGWVT